MSDLGHLTPAARQLAEQSEAVRIDRILSDRWIAYTRATKGLDKLKWLLTHPKKVRMPNLLICGPTNNGKTALTEKFLRSCQKGRSLDGRADVVPVLRVQMSSADPLRFYQAILEGLAAPVWKGHRLVECERQALHLMRATCMRMLVLDELQHCLFGPNHKISEVLNILKHIGNELQIPIVGVGTKEALQVVHSDDQLANRFEPFPLPRWRDDDETRMLLNSFESTLPLRRWSDLSNPTMARRILAMSEGILGEMSTIITRSAEMGVRSGEERIDLGILDAIDYQPPSSQRIAPVPVLVD